MANVYDPRTVFLRGETLELLDKLEKMTGVTDDEAIIKAALIALHRDCMTWSDNSMRGVIDI